MISVLCVHPQSNYFKIPKLDLWTEERNAYNFAGSNPVITHAPCEQWSRMHAFAKENPISKELAFFCYEYVNKNGGIFEHPAGSHFFKTVKADFRKIKSVDQHWWGFPCRKRTYLYVSQVNLLSYPLNFSAHAGTLDQISKNKRSIMPLSFCQYLVDSVANS